MSEEQNSEAVKKESESPRQPDRVVLDDAQIAAIKAEVKADIEAGQKRGETYTKADVDQKLQEQSQRIAQAISGEKGKKELDPVTVRMLTDTKGFLTEFGTHLIETTKRDTRREVEEARAVEREEATHIAKLRDERPDISNSDAAAKVFFRILDELEPSEPIAARIKEATRVYDLEMEELGMGDAETRRAKAIGNVDRAGASSAEANNESAAKSELETYTDELASRQARHKAIRDAVV